MRNCWHGNKLRTDNGNQYVLEKKDKFGRIFLRRNTANVPLIVTAHRKINGLPRYAKEIAIADGWDWFTFFCIVMSFSLLFLFFMFVQHVDFWHFMLFIPIFGLLGKLAHSSFYNHHMLIGGIFVGAACALLVTLIAGANDVSASFGQIGEPEQTATAEIYAMDDGIVHISDATVVTDDGTMMSADDFFDMNGHYYVSGGNNPWLSVKVDDGIDSPYLSVLTKTFSSDNGKMGTAGKIIDGLFHYSDRIRNETSVVLYVPDGMTVDYGDRE